MTENSKVVVKYDTCTIELNFSIFFEQQSLVKIRKVFKMMSDRPVENREATANLSNALYWWVEDLAQDVEYHKVKLKETENDAITAERNVARFGSVATAEMKQEHREKYRAYLAAQRDLKRAQTAYQRGVKILTAFKDIKEKTIIKGV